MLLMVLSVDVQVHAGVKLLATRIRWRMKLQQLLEEYCGRTTCAAKQTYARPSEVLLGEVDDTLLQRTPRSSFLCGFQLRLSTCGGSLKGLTPTTVTTIPSSFWPQATFIMSRSV
jgi:hypothetical protein